MTINRMMAAAGVLWVALIAFTPPAAAQTKEEGIRLYNKAMSLENRSQTNDDLKQAAHLYEKALEIFEKIKFKQGIAAAANNLANVNEDWGHYDKAARYYGKSLAAARDLKDRRGEGTTLNNLGILHARWAQYDKSEDFFEKSLSIDRELKDPQGEAETLNNLGNVHSDWGLYDKAVGYYRKSLAVTRELEDRRGESRVLMNLGAVYYCWGRYGKAVKCYGESLSLDRELNDRRGEGKTLNNLGLVYADWGQYDKAVECYEKALVIRRDLNDRIGEGHTLNNLGRILAHQGRYETALEMYRKALRRYTEIGVPTDLSENLIANLLLDAGDADRALPFVKKSGYNSTWGRLYLLEGNYRKAKGFYEKLLKSADRTGNTDHLFTACTGLGLAWEGMEDYAKAVKYFLKAVKYTEELRSSLTRSQSEKFFDVRINGFFRTAPYEGLARVLLRMNQPLDALKISESTKARVFAESLSRWSQGERFDVPEGIMRKDSQLTDLLASLKKQRWKAYEMSNRLAMRALDSQIEALEDKLKAHTKMLRREYPLFAATKYPEPMHLSQTALEEDEWVLSYDVTDSGVIIYLTKAKELIKASFKPVAREELDGLIRKFRDPLEVTEETFDKKLRSFDFASGKKLSDLLFSDVLSALPEGMPVIVVPDDSLGVLPFETLVLNDSGQVTLDGKYPTIQGAELFGDRNPISYYQSITALTLARTFGEAKKAASKRMVMADPVFDVTDSRLANINLQRRIALAQSMPDTLLSIKNQLNITFPRLALTGDLAKNLKDLDPRKTDLYTGMKASKPILFENPLGKYGEMVFATHGYFGKDLPGIQEPVLILTLPGQPDGEDGFLRMREVMGLKLNADVVALTACQTGLGRKLTGEGTMGMGRAFQYAGAKAVLMTLWSVSQKSSVTLVESFFRHLKERKSKLDALRLARKEIRESGYDHPFFWAAFILAGEVN